MNSATPDLIASEADLEAFCNQPIEERSLTEPLRGVLAETAITGVVRYKWALLRPLVEFAMEKVMRDYDGQGQDAVGPSRYSAYGETVMQTLDRFKTLLSTFADAPWTLQRMCELVLEPRKQYTQLHKIALAIEKCLLVTSEVPTSSNPPPMPHLAALSNVNSNPPPVYQAAPAAAASEGEGPGGPEGAAGAAGVVKVREDDGGAAFVGAMLEVRVAGGGTGGGAGPQGTATGSSSAGGGGAGGSGTRHSPHSPHHVSAGNHSGLMEHIEEDHWPDNKAGPGLPGLHNALHHHRDKDSQHHPAQPAAAQPSLPAPHSLLPLLGQSAAPQPSLPAPHSLLPLLAQQRQAQQPAGGSPATSPPSSRHSSEAPAASAAAAAEAAEQPDAAPCSQGDGLELEPGQGQDQDQDMADASVGGQDAGVGGKVAAHKAQGPGDKQQTNAEYISNSNGMEE